MPDETQNDGTDHDPFKVEEKHQHMPEFFQGMACAYEDVARMLEDMKSNLPEELKFMDSGMDTMVLGVRGKIGHLEVAVASNMKKEDMQ